MYVFLLLWCNGCMMGLDGPLRVNAIQYKQVGHDKSIISHKMLVHNLLLYSP